MTSTPTPARKRAKTAPVARLRDAAATQKAILAAARKHFARSGYEGALLRDIAADAGADAALINRYFGGKDGLFQAVIERALHPELFVQGDREKFGKRAAAALAGKGGAQSEQGLEAFALMLHAATSKHAVKLLDKAVQAKFMGPIREWLGGDQSGARARLFTAMMTGLLVERMVRNEAVPAEEEAAFKARVADMLQTLIDG
jgi:AcrR family transcriptional regulator